MEIDPLHPSPPDKDDLDFLDVVEEQLDKEALCKEHHTLGGESNNMDEGEPTDNVKAVQSGLRSLQLDQKEKVEEVNTLHEIEEQEDEVEDKKRHLNVVFIGRVDAGKSTAGGQILFLSGQVDGRTIQKYEKEAKDKSCESWYMAYIMDTNEEERAKGKTVEVGRAHFETENTRFTILDAPESPHRATRVMYPT